jgi:hypothetical protein
MSGRCSSAGTASHERDQAGENDGRFRDTPQGRRHGTEALGVVNRRPSAACSLGGRRWLKTPQISWTADPISAPSETGTGFRAPVSQKRPILASEIREGGRSPSTKIRAWRETL